RCVIRSRLGFLQNGSGAEPAVDDSEHPSGFADCRILTSVCAYIGMWTRRSFELGTDQRPAWKRRLLVTKEHVVPRPATLRISRHTPTRKNRFGAVGIALMAMSIACVQPESNWLREAAEVRSAAATADSALPAAWRAAAWHLGFQIGYVGH